MAASAPRAPRARTTTSCCPRACSEIVDRQIELGVDIVNDGEYVKAGSYGGYIQERVTGYSTRAGRPEPAAASAPARPSATAATSPASTRPACGSQGSGGPIRPGFMTPGEVRQHQPARDERVCTGPDHVHGQADGQERHRQPQGGARGQGRRGLHRRARAAEPGRGRAQRVLPERRGVHDGRRGGRPRGVQGDHRRRPHPAGRRARVLHLLDVLPRLDASRSTASTSSSASRSSTTRSGPARGADPLPRLLGQRPPPAHQRHRAQAHRRPAC